jgi:sorting nexin-41/42
MDDWEILDSQYDPPRTPSTTSDEARPRRSLDEESDEEAAAEAQGELVPRRKPGGYDSRIEQMLYENPELPILIIDAGRSTETGGRFIVYTIKTGVGPHCASLSRGDANWPAGTHRSATLL